MLDRCQPSGVDVFVAVIDIRAAHWGDTNTRYVLTCCPEQMPSLWHEGECERGCARAVLD